MSVSLARPGTVQFTVPRSLTGPGVARRRAAATLRNWGLIAVADDLLMGLSELVTNAVLYGQDDITVRLARRGRDALLCEVTDGGSWLPRCRDSGSIAENGRGIAIVAAIAAAFGTRPAMAGPGKTVWFSLQLPATTAEPRPPAENPRAAADLDGRRRGPEARISPNGATNR